MPIIECATWEPTDTTGGDGAAWSRVGFLSGNDSGSFVNDLFPMIFEGSKPET